MQCLSNFERCQQILFCRLCVQNSLRSTHPPSLGLWLRKTDGSDFNSASWVLLWTKLHSWLIKCKPHHSSLTSEKGQPCQMNSLSVLARLHYGYSPSPHRNIYLENHNFDSFFWRSYFCNIKFFSGTFPRCFWKLFLPSNLPSPSLPKDTQKWRYYFLCVLSSKFENVPLSWS